MKVNRAQKFAIGVLGAITLFLLYVNYAVPIAINWNSIVNDTASGILGGVITMALTIVVYRIIYHRRSRK